MSRAIRAAPALTMPWSLLLSVLLWGASAGSARAQEQQEPQEEGRVGCPTPTAEGMPEGPAQVGLLDGELGVARRLCPRSEIGFAAAALLVADLDAFYGNVRASAVVWGSWSPGDGRTELFAAAEALRLQTVISSIDAQHVGVGHLSLGGTRALVAREGWRFGASTRLVLPTAVGLYDNAWPLALDLLAELEWSASSLLRLHGHAGGLGSFALSGGPAAPRGALVLGGGAALRALSWLAILLELDTSFGRTATVDHLALAGALRIGVGDRFGAELGAVFPLAGRERALATAVLRASWRL